MKQNRFIYLLVVLVILLITFFYFINSNSFQKENNGSFSGKDIQSLDRSIDELVITRHAKCRMECRDVTRQEIESILKKGTINYSKTDLEDRRGPSYAIEGYGDDRQHLRIVFAPKKNKLVVVTCIDLDKEWECDCN